MQCNYCEYKLQVNIVDDDVKIRVVHIHTFDVIVLVGDVRVLDCWSVGS